MQSNFSVLTSVESSTIIEKYESLKSLIKSLKREGAITFLIMTAHFVL